MPGGFVIDVGRRLVISAGWGTLTYDDLLGHVRGIQADPGFDPGFSHLVDLRSVTDLSTHGAGVRLLAAENPFARDARRSVLVATDVAFGVARMYQGIADESPDRMRIFRDDEDAALRWIGVPDDAAAIRRALEDLLPPPTG